MKRPLPVENTTANASLRKRATTASPTARAFDGPVMAVQADAAEKISIQVLDRVFALLQVLCEQDGPVALKDICAHTGLSPSTAHRILNDLVAGRLVERSHRSYRLGLRLLELGNIVRERLNVREIALPLMRTLHRQIRQPVSLSLRQGDEIVYVERAYSESSGMQVVRAIGARAPLHLTSNGKLFLAADDSQRIRAYATRTGLPGHTHNSLTQLPALERELALVRQNGVAHDNEELEIGVRCMAVGIRDDQATLVAALSISAPADRMDPGWLPHLQAVAQEVSAALGCPL